MATIEITHVRSQHGSRRLPNVRILQLGLLVAILIVWEIVGRNVSPLILSPFSKTVVAWVDLVVSGKLPVALAASLQALVIGFVLAVMVGVGAGLLLGRFTMLQTIGDFYLTLTMATPMATIIPVINIFFGFSLTARVVVVFLFSVVVITVNTLAGIRGIDYRLPEMARSFGASERQVWGKILMPAALPAIMAGIRLGLARAVLGMVVSELILSSIGLGNLLLYYENRFDTDYLFALVITLIAIGVGLLAMVQALESRLTRWKVAAIE